jgi:hypothetical protein
MDAVEYNRVAFGHQVGACVIMSHWKADRGKEYRATERRSFNNLAAAQRSLAFDVIITSADRGRRCLSVTHNVVGEVTSMGRSWQNSINSARNIAG